MKKLLAVLSLSLIVGFVFGQTNNQDNGGLSLKIGYSVVQHLEPQIYGQNVNTQSVSTTYGGTLSGMETLNGVNLKIYYFFKNNIGIYSDLGFGVAGNSVFYQNDQQPFIHYETKADFNNQSLGIASRFQSDKAPVKFIIGTSLGRYGHTMSLSQTSNGLGQWYDGTYDVLKFGLEGMISYRVIKGLNIFTEINYSTQLNVDADNFNIEYTSDSGDYYKISYNSPSMAAIRMTIGFGYDF